MMGVVEAAGLPRHRSSRPKFALVWAGRSRATQLAASCLALVLLLVSLAASADSTEDFFWEVSKGCKTVAGTEMYLDRYPAGLYAAEARECLARWQKEQDAWDRVKSCRDREDVERFLAEFSKGRYGEEARKCLERWSDVNFQIERKNEACEEHFKANRLLTGVGGTAVECWGEVLSRDPSNMVAIDGLNRVFGKYAGWARKALGQGKVVKVQGYVEKLKRLNPEAPEVGELEEAMELFGKYLAGAQAALEEGDLGAAGEQMGKLKGLYPEAPQVKELEEKIAEAESSRAPEPVPEPQPEPVPEPDPDPAPEPVPEPPPAVSEKFRDCDACPLMVVVPEGSYRMGNDWHPHERPEHTVTIAKPFAAGVHEVTFAEWDACRDDGGCSHNPDDRGWGRGTRPVINVSWKDARQYVQWLSRKTGKHYRLLSESEWEYVARAGSSKAYSWGASLYIPGSKRANCVDCGSRWDGRRTAPVGSFPENDFGLHDVHGNVWERVEDCWNAGAYFGAPQDGRAQTRGQCSIRMMRGGSWKDKPWDMRTSHRGLGADDKRSDTAGFRVARTLTP